MAKLWKVLLGLLLSTGVVWAAANRTTITNILRVEESGGPSAAVIQAPSLASDYTLTLPPNDGDADQLLRTDGSGALTWTKIVDAMIDAAAAISYSKLDLNDAVVNADINSAAGIEYSKLDLTDSIVNADIDSAAAISYSKLNLANSVTDGDIAAAAGIDASKLGNGDVSDTELSYVNGVTSAIQTQINGKLNLSGGTLTGPLTLNADATGSLEPVTKQQFDAAINGIAWKQPARAATTTAGTLASDFENGDTVDGVVLATGDRLLVKNQVTDSENGLYTVAVSGAPTRTADGNDYAELEAAAVIIQEGTANANKGFYQITELSGFSGQSWIQNFGTGLYVADGQGIELNGSTFELELNGSTLAKGASGLSVNQSSLTLDNLGGTLSVNKGGTGAITAGSARSNLGAAASGANSDITSISGLTTALSIAQGGTGQTTAANAINALVPTQSGNTGRFLKTDGSVVSWGDASGGPGGSGGVSVITNGSAVSDTTGWTDDGTHTNTRVTSGSPLAPTVSTAFSFEASASTTESETSGVYWSVSSMPPSLRSKKLKVEFYVTVPANDVWRLSVWAGATRLPLSTDSGSVTTLPAGYTGKFTTYVDTSTATAYSVNFTQTTWTGVNPLVVTQVVFGDGIQPQGAAVGDWISYTPTGSWNTNVTYTGRYRRVGDSMEIFATVVCSGAPNATNLSINIPTGFTIDTTKLVSTTAGRQPLGVGNANDSGVRSYPLSVYYGSTTSVFVVSAETTGDSSGLISEDNPFTFGSADAVGVFFTAPISEWAGSGTVNVAQNDVEYASNYGTTWTGDDTTSFSYGPSGSDVPPSSLTSARRRRIQFQTPIQVTDQLILEVSGDSGVTWTDSSKSTLGIYTIGGATEDYGVTFQKTGITDARQIDVRFQRYRRPGATWDAAGADWAGGIKWRVVKAKSGQAVGFGEASTTSLGLVKPSFSAYGASQVSFSSASGLVRSGTYTPTSAATLNLDAAPTVTANTMIWSQTGKVVQVSGYVAVNANGIGAAAFTLTLPVVPTANFSGDFEAAGMCAFFTSGLGTQAEVGSVNSTNGAKTVTIGFYASDTSASRNLWYQFQYVTN